MKKLFKQLQDLFINHKRFFIPMTIILVSVTLVMILGYLGFRSILKQNLDIVNNNIINNIVYNLNTELKSCSQTVEMVAKEIRDTPSEEREKKLTWFASSMETLYGFDLKNVSFILDNKEYSYINPNYSITSQPWYNEVLQENNEINIFSETVDNTNHIVVEYSIAEPTIVVAVCFNEEKIYRDINYNSQAIGNIYIVNNEGIIISTNSDNIDPAATTIITGTGLDSVIPNSETYSQIMNTTSGVKSYIHNASKYRCYYNSIYEQWHVVMVSKESELYSGIIKMNIWEFILTICILIVVTILYYNSYASNLKTEAASKAQAAFFANMSHEIRTPLNAIIGMSEIILRRSITSEVRNDALSIHNAGTGLLTIINDILDLSKIDSGKFEIINDEYVFPSLITEVVNIISFRINNPDINFIININPNVPVRLIGDEVRLKQIIMNLLSNAVKFTHQGYIKMEIDWNFIDNEETTLSIKVSDTGIGIKEEELSTIFHEFQQADKKRNRTVSGTGLGLAISKRLAEQMGGTITVESQYGKGTSFTVTVKNKVKRYEPIAVVSENKKHTVIIYETNQVIIQNLRNTLKSLDVLYFICKTPEELLNVKNGTHLLFRTKWRKDIGKVFKQLNPRPRVIEVTDISEGGKENAVENRHIFLPLIGFQLADFLNEEFSNEYTVSSYDARDVVTIPDAKILIVDDNATNMAVAKGLLAQYQMQIDTADNGETAIEMIKKKKYDMVFMDNMMPGMSGIEATQKIRSTYGPYFQKLPIVALTATISRTAKEEFLTKGFNAYLSKPMDLNKLDTILHKYLEKKIVKISNMKTVEINEPTVEPNYDVLVDFDMGIKQLGGSKEAYLDILKVFVNDLKKKRNSLSTHLNNKNLSGFTIEVHAVKSAAANIKAAKLSKIAAKMEQFGKNGDMASIKENSSTLFDEMIKVAIACEEFIENAIPKNPEPVATQNSIPQEFVTNLKEACENLDMIRIELIFNQLNIYSYPLEIQQYINMLGSGIMEFDYDIISQAIEGLSKQN